MSTKQAVLAWLGVAGGVIGFFFFSLTAAEFMR